MRQVSFVVLAGLVSLQAAAAAPKLVSVASPGLRGIDISPERAELYTGVVSQALGSRYVVVVTPQDLAALLGLERQKALLGCSESSVSCTAEIAAAFGADALLRGDVARIGSEFHATLKLISPRDGHALAAREVIETDEARFAAELKAAGQALSTSLLASLGRTAELDELEKDARNHRLTTAAWVPLGVGVAGLVVGGVLMGISGGSYQKLTTEPRLEDAEATSLANEGSRMQTTGVIFLAVGGAAAVAGAVMLIIGKTSPVAVAVAPSPAGGSLVVSGSF